MWTYLLVEDEPPARDLLRAMIQRIRPEARCLGEAADGLQALELLSRIQPRCLFLDIEFPPAGAFGLLKAAKERGLQLPPIVFVTAYDHHAVEAFRWAACDYLLKPVEPGQLAEAMSRVDPRAPALDVAALLAGVEAAEQKHLPECFSVPHRGRRKVIRWPEVTHLATENRLLFVHTAEGRFVLDRTLDALEPMLHPHFLRVHRSVLVALSAISELEAESGAKGEVILRDGTRLPVSRERLPEVRQRLGGG